MLPAGSYSLSHTGDAYLGLHSLNGEGLSIAPSLQQQVCIEGSCTVDLNAIDPATQSSWIPTPSLAPFDLDLSSDPFLLTYSTPPITLNTNKLTLFHPGYQKKRNIVSLKLFNCYHISHRSGTP